MEANQPCLDRTAKVLQAFVEDELPDLLGELPVEQNPSTMVAENLPCPRLTGAVFSPRGNDVVFLRTSSRLLTHAISQVG